MKLHLGCGERYLNGYINIDYPITKHTIQKQIVADRLIDIQKLKYPKGSIEEIRLHHVFEHFSRAITCALLVIWHTWLKKGGLLQIEVPDFSTMAFKIINPFFPRKEKSVANRHIFGSQEASWATHFTGYTSNDIKNLLEKFGFKVNKINKSNWKGTSNIEVFATRNKSVKNIRDYEEITKNFLSQFLLDSSKSEQKLLEVWMKIYKDQIEKSLG